MARQYELETTALDATVAEYREQLQSLLSLGRGASLQMSQRLMVQWFGPLCEAIDREQAAIWRRDPGSDRALYGPYLILLPPEKLAVIAMHEVLNLCLVMGGCTRLVLAASRVGEAVQAEVNMMKIKYKDRRAWSKLAAEGTGGQHPSVFAVRKAARKVLADAADWPARGVVKAGGALVALLLRTANVEVAAAAASGGEGEERLAAEADDPVAAAVPLSPMARQLHEYYSRPTHGASDASRVAKAKATAAAATAHASAAAATSGVPATGAAPEFDVDAASFAADGAIGDASSPLAAMDPDAAELDAAVEVDSLPLAGDSDSELEGAAGEGPGPADGSVAGPAPPLEAAAAASSGGASGGVGPVRTVPAFRHVYHFIFGAASFASSPQASGNPFHSHPAAAPGGGGGGGAGAAASAGGRSSSSSSSISSSGGRSVGMLALHPRVMEQLAGTSGSAGAALRCAHPTHFPMVVPPRRWTGPFEGGYLRQRTPLLRTLPGYRSQVELAREARMPRLYGALDALGALPWRVNAGVLGIAEAVWAAGGGLAEVPARADLPLPAPPAPAALAALTSDEERTLALRRFRRAQNGAMRANADLHSLRCDASLKLAVARRFADERALYFPHNVDFRGRAYPVPPHLNHMGSDLCRGLLTFAAGKPLGPRGLRWLKIHIANLAGRDKVSLDDRAAFTEAHMAQVVDSAARPLAGNGWWLRADSPWQALAACRELAAAYSRPCGGRPEDYECALPVHQDGSCNGLQHYAALGRDEAGGRAVNLVPMPGPDTGPQDVYSRVLHLVLRKMEADAAGETLSPGLQQYNARGGGGSGFGSGLRGGGGGGGGGGLDPTNVVASAFATGNISTLHAAAASMGVAAGGVGGVAAAAGRATLERDALRERLRQLAAQFLRGAVDRKVVKQTVMTSVYGVTFIGAREQILARLKERFDATALAAASSAAAGAGGATTPPMQPSDATGGTACGGGSGAAPVVPASRLAAEELDDALFVCASYLARTTLDSLGDLFASADAIKRWLGDVARLVALAEQPMCWVTPLGLPVVQPYRRDRALTVKTLLQDVAIVDTSEQLPVSAARQRSAFPPNFVHSLDSTHMMMTALDCCAPAGPAAGGGGPIAFAAVHDSYWTHACDVDAMSASLRAQFIGLYSMPLLEDLRDSLALRFPHVVFPELPPRGTLDLAAVAGSRYFFS